MINLHESMGPDRDRIRDPWICSQTRTCSQTRYRLRYAARRLTYCAKYITIRLSTVNKCKLTPKEVTADLPPLLVLTYFPTKTTLGQHLPVIFEPRHEISNNLTF